MLRLEINGQNVELGSDFAITINGKNPMFNDIGTFSYPFKLKNTPRNARLFNWLHRLSSPSDPYSYHQCSIFFDGIMIERGTLRLQSAGDFYEGSIYAGNGNFNYEIKERLLQYFDFGREQFDDDDEYIQWVNTCNSLNYPDAKVCFPMIYNNLFTGSDPGYVDARYYNYVFDGSAQITILDSEGLHNKIVPFTYLQLIFDTIFPALNYTHKDLVFLPDDELKRLVLYSSVDINRVGWPSTLFYNNSLPRVKCIDFFSGLGKYFNCRVFVNTLLQRAEIKSLTQIANSSDYLQWKSIINERSIDFEERFKGIVVQMNTDGGDGVWGTFLETERANEEYIWGGVIKESDLPFYPLVLPDERCYVEEINQWRKHSYTNSWSADATFPDKFSTKIIKGDYGNADIKIETAFSTLLQDRTTETYVVPNCTNNRDDWKKITPRLLFVESWGYLNLLKRAHNQLQNNSLFWVKAPGAIDSTVGLFEKQYQDYLNWYVYRKRLVKVKKIMTVDDILNLDFSKKVRFNGINFLIKEYSLTLRKDRIEPAQFELYKAD